MSKKYITVTSATWAAAIDTTTALSGNFRLSSITLHFDTAPAQAGDITFTVIAKDWAIYDNILFSVDPSTASDTDITYTPTNDLIFEEWDQIEVAYANADTRTYGLRIVTQGL